MGEKKIIKILDFLWFFSCILYILPALLIFNWFISSVVPEIPGAMQQQSPTFVLAMTFFVAILPFFTLLLFGGISFRNWYLIKKEKNKGVKESKIFAFLSLIIFGMGTVYFILYFPSSIGFSSILFSIFITLILMFDIIIIVLSLKFGDKELTALSSAFNQKNLKK